MSKDVVDKLLYEIFTNNILEKSNLYTIPDDLVISAIVQLETIQPYNFNTTTIYSKQTSKIEDPSKYDEHIYHIRNRTDLIYGNRFTDVMNIVEQVRYFYQMPDFLSDLKEENPVIPEEENKEENPVISEEENKEENPVISEEENPLIPEEEIKEENPVIPEEEIKEENPLISRLNKHKKKTTCSIM